MASEQDVAANHLQWAGHLPDWITPRPAEPDQNPRCSVCGLHRGFRPSWTVHPHWGKR